MCYLSLAAHYKILSRSQNIFDVTIQMFVYVTIEYRNAKIKFKHFTWHVVIYVEPSTLGRLRFHVYLF